MDKVRATVLEASRVFKAKSLLVRYGVDICYSRSAFRDSRSLILADVRVIEAKKYILCTGSSARIPEIEGLNEGCLTNHEI